MSQIELSPKRQKRRREARERQEKRWKAKCGPVTVRWVEPEPRKERKKAGHQANQSLDDPQVTG